MLFYKIKFHPVIFVVFLSFVTGCATQQKHVEIKKTPIVASQHFPEQNKIKQALYRQHNEWKGTRYKLGGLSKRGIDCSGFVQVTFLSRFGLSLPRTTRTQVKAGKTINKNSLRTGDLVFFKTSPTVNHVGIYLEDGQFLHASFSKGVMISRLDNVYWTRKYWKSVRVSI